MSSFRQGETAVDSGGGGGGYGGGGGGFPAGGGGGPSYLNYRTYCSPGSTAPATTATTAAGSDGSLTFTYKPRST